MDERRILLIVGGGIAAYKALELVRLYRKAGLAVRAVLTRAGAEFVTPLSLSTLSEDRVFSDLFTLTDEQEIGHIELSRQADLLVVAPATASLMAKAAAGIADDLATTVLLATLGQHRGHRMPALLEQPHQLERLVGGDPPADDQQNACHA